MAAEVTKTDIRPPPEGARQVIAGDEITVHYVGRIQGGHVFDSSRSRDRPFTFMLGTGGVIKGWEQGLLLMRVGETAKLVCPPKLAYGRKGMGDKVPPDSTLEFEIEVLSAFQPIEKEVLEDTDSNVTPKETDYVRINMIVKAEDGAVRDTYFEKRPLEFYLKDHSGCAEVDGRWRPGNIIKKCVENMRLHEKAKFVVKEEITDKHGNKPFWGTGTLVLEITLNTIGADEDITGDGGVMKHRISEGEGYEKATDGASLRFHLRVMRGHSPFQGAIRHSAQHPTDPAPAGGGGGGTSAGDKATGKRAVDYSKWDRLEVTDDGEVVETVPESAEKALEEAAEAQRQRDSAMLLSTFDSEPWTIVCGYGETAEGLEAALMTMKKNERSVVRIRADYGFSAHDRDAPSTELAADEPLSYEVLLISIDKGREHWNLDEDGKLKWGTQKRLRGNDFFKRGNYRRALGLYQPLVSSFFMKMPQRPSEAARGQQFKGDRVMNMAPHLKPADQSADSPAERELKLKLQLPSLLNIAACHLRQNNNRQALEACERALALEEGNVKALFRRAKAYTALCDFDKAEKDLSAVLAAESDNADAHKELAAIAAAKKKADAVQKKAFSGFFASSPAAAADPTATPAAQAAPSESTDGGPGVVVYKAPEGDGDFDEAGNPRARVMSVRKYPLPTKDVAPKVRIAGMVGGDASGGSDDGGDE